MEYEASRSSMSTANLNEPSEQTSLLPQGPITKYGEQTNQSLSSPYSQTQDNTGDYSWLRQNLLGVIVTYNKMIKTRTLAKKGSRYLSTKASNYWNKQNNEVPETASAQEKRVQVIDQALTSLLPQNYERTTGKSIAEAGVVDVGKGLGSTMYNKSSSMYNRFFGTKRQGGKLKRGTRKNKRSKK